MDVIYLFFSVFNWRVVLFLGLVIYFVRFSHYKKIEDLRKNYDESLSRFLAKAKDGHEVRVEYSPNSKYIWRIERVEDLD